jgi:redox-sensitive bicupin YhaK (pirin superfamily)
MTRRTLATAHEAARHDIKDLVTRCPLPGPALPHLNPFLILHHHGPQVYRPDNHGLPFGPHPHRGFETVTFVLEGSLAHCDTGGNESIIDAGGVQWMTAGKGLVHAELSPEAFKRDGGPLEILQLWLNLPASMKMVRPRYAGVQRDAIPAVVTSGGKAQVHVVAGTVGAARGPVASLTHTFMAVVRLLAGGRVEFEGIAGRVVFLYVVRGEIDIEGRRLAQFELGRLSDDGDTLAFESTSDATVLFGHAAPIDEPIAMRGPFVMNTQAELTQAFQDFQHGWFEVPATDATNVTNAQALADGMR